MWNWQTNWDFFLGNRFHPNQLANALFAEYQWNVLVNKFPQLVGDINPHNAEILARFGDQGTCSSSLESPPFMTSLTQKPSRWLLVQHPVSRGLEEFTRVSK
jgi:hypothetical protein